MTAVQRTVLFDYGGVLTTPLGPSFATFEAMHGIDQGRCFELLVAASRGRDGGIIGAIERGEMDADDFEARLRTLLVDAGYRPPDDVHLLDGLFGGVHLEEDSWELVSEVRATGARTGLLSNSWGMGIYPWDRVEAHFDVAVISGQVGLRKPDPAIYELAIERCGGVATDCLFIDDLPANLEVASELGMRTVHHTGEVAPTAAAVRRFLTSGDGR
jgi:epoxide hydrolase-like predicted phosphatase